MTNEAVEHSTADDTPGVQPDTPGAYILDQYLADFSIENPGGRVPLEQAAELVLGLNVAVSTGALPDAPAGMFAVQIEMSMPARLGERIIFLIELRYRVNVRVQGVSMEETPALLHVQIPNAVFPVLKRIVEKNGAFAGYPEITLLPIDFAAMLESRFEAVAQS
jgi:preprotein translocase subunit SecB